MPVSTFHVAAVRGPERRQNRHTRIWFKVWTIERQPDDAEPIGESLAGYETSNAWMASLCKRAMENKPPLALTVLWKQSPWLRQIVEITLAPKESAA
jgi:hypothetical protein